MNLPDLLVPVLHWMILIFNFEEHMKHQELAIDGMSCGHCGKAIIDYDQELVSDEDILQAIDVAGFRLAMG